MIFAVLASVVGGLILGFGIGFIWRDAWLSDDDVELQPSWPAPEMQSQESNVILMSDEEVAKLEAKLKRKSYQESDGN